MPNNNIQDKLLLKSIYPLVASLLMTFFAFGQSETNNPITYDTTITEQVVGPSFTWTVRITRQANDRTPRPVIFSMQGTGEVGSNPATLLTYGPHYLLANGLWDGSVKLGNGTHYPILVTIMEPSQNMRPWDLKVVFEALLKALPINPNAVHVAGLSQGSWEWGELIEYSASAGDFSTMSQIKSWVDLEGVAPGDNFSGYNMTYPSAFGYWASHYGGKFFGLEGNTDPRFVWQVSQNMNAAVANSAFFSYENIGGGGHCCWNSMYDPTVTNWTSTNPNLVTTTTAPNTPGDYKNGSNIFQWELRQGDTTLVSSTTTTAPPTVSAGGDPTITLPTNSITLTATATAASGTTLASEAWTQTSGPGTATISKPTGSLSTTVSNLVAGTYVFTFTGTNNLGQSASNSVDVVVNPLAASSATVPVVSAGSAQTVSGSSATLTGTASAASGTTLSTETWKETSGPNSATINATSSLSTAISNLVAGTYVFTLTTTNNLGQSTSSTVTVVVKAASTTSTVPTVSAGSAQTLTAPASSTTLTGTATAASGTTLVSGSWKETSGPNTATIGSPTNAYSTAISGLVAGTYVFTFTAVNNLGQSASSTVSVIVSAAVSTLPTVSAGSAQSITSPASSSYLTGTATAASGTTLVSASWKETSGPSTAKINDPTDSYTTPISGLVVGTYVFTFTTTNNLGQSASSTVTVTVKGSTVASTVPTASAGDDPTITLPTNSLTLTGTATAASGTTLVSGSWKETSGPNTAKITSPTNSYTTLISGLVAGSYVFTFTAVNNLGQSSSSNVAVIVKAATSTLPTVSAGSAQSITSPASSSYLTGTATAANGTTLVSGSWKETSGPGTAKINDPTDSYTTPISGLVVGTYVFTFTATNNLGQSASSTVSVTVKAATAATTPSSPDEVTTGSTSTVPKVVMGAAQTITLPTSSATVTSVSTPATGTTLATGLWKQTSGPSTATIASTVSSSTAVTGLKAGSYVFSYTITNNLSQSTTGTTTVTVDAAATTSTLPEVTVGAAQTITLPTSSVTLTSTASAASGTTLVSGLWKQTSGPSTATIASASGSSTSATGLSSAGTYVFSYTITNNLAQTATGSTTITVDAAASTTTSSSTVPVIVATGEYQTLFIDQNKYLWAIGGNLETEGTGVAGDGGTIQRVLFSPANLQIKTAASCLHGGLAVDISGNVWTWGQGESGEIGNGVIYTDQVLTPIKLTLDNNGNTFNNVTSVYCYYSMNNARGTYAIKGDGTLWVWGGTYEGMAANGTTGTNVTRPTQITIPGGRKASSLACGDILILLCTDGSVWTCGGGIAGVNPNLGYNATGNDYLTLHQLDLPSNIVQVAGATNEFDYALTSEGTLYGWGSYSSYMGGTGGYAANTYFYTPQLLTSRLNLPYPIKSITANMVCTHAILTNGTLWGWGDNAEGVVGNGHQLNFATTTMPYSWDFGPAELLQQAPVQISSKTDFVAVYGEGPFVMFDFAEEANGQLWSWGRNKGSVLANGVNGCTPDVGAQYPNSWDVTSPQAVDPFTVTKYVLVPSPYCTSDPAGLYCAACLLADALYNPTVIATVSATTSSNALVAATSITTSSAATTTTGTTGTILSESSPTVAETGTGAISTTSTSGSTASTSSTSGTTTDSTSDTAVTPATTGAATVSTTTGTLRVQSAGSFSVATLDGSQSRAIDSTGSIVSYRWSQASGAQTIIRDTTAAATDVIGLAPGTYAFRLIVTDNQGRSSSAVDSLIIENPAPSGLPGADATNTAGLAAYPTIAHSSVNLVLNTNLTGAVRLNVFSSTGALVQAQEQNKGQTELVTDLNISSLSSGVYIVQAVVGGQTSFTTKFIKQ